MAFSRVVWLFPRRFRSREVCLFVVAAACFLFTMSITRTDVGYAQQPQSPMPGVDADDEQQVQAALRQRELNTVNGIRFDAAADLPPSNAVVPLTPHLEKMDAFRLPLSDRPRHAPPPVDLSHCGGRPTADRRPPEDLVESFEFQKVSSDTDAFVFSAHLDRRQSSEPLVTIIGLTPEYVGGSHHERHCRLWYVGDQQPEVTSLRTRYVSESHGRKYGVAMHVCRVRDNSSVPYAVSLIGSACDTTTPNLLKVVGSSSTGPPINYTVCVTPFNFNYNNYHQLVEIVETNRIFGAQHFIFYNHSTGAVVRQYADVYAREGLITVVPWPLKIAVEVWPPVPGNTPEVHYFAQLAALNDCLYRAAHRSTFVVFTDLDELLVPRSREDWTSMFSDASVNWKDPSSAVGESLPRREDGNFDDGRLFPGGYIVRSSFFRTDWPSDQNVPKAASDFQILSLLKTQRESKVYDHYQRSKFVVWSKACTMVGVHQPLEMVHGTTTVNVDERTALVHHYRLWMDDPQIRIVIDRYMHRFAGEVVRRVTTRHRYVDEQLRQGDGRRRNPRLPGDKRLRDGRSRRL